VLLLALILMSRARTLGEESVLLEEEKEGLIEGSEDERQAWAAQALLEALIRRWWDEDDAQQGVLVCSYLPGIVYCWCMQYQNLAGASVLQELEGR